MAWEVHRSVSMSWHEQNSREVDPHTFAHERNSRRYTRVRRSYQTCWLVRVLKLLPFLPSWLADDYLLSPKTAPPLGAAHPHVFDAAEPRIYAGTSISPRACHDLGALRLVQSRSYHLRRQRGHSLTALPRSRCRVESQPGDLMGQDARWSAKPRTSR